MPVAENVLRNTEAEWRFVEVKRVKSKKEPSNPCSRSSSRASISTSVSTSSSTRSALFMNTIIWERPICRANRRCSRVCAITPSVAAITKTFNTFQRTSRRSTTVLSTKSNLLFSFIKTKKWGEQNLGGEDANIGRFRVGKDAGRKDVEGNEWDHII